MSDEEKEALKRAEKLEARLDALLQGMEDAKERSEENRRMNRWDYFAASAMQAGFSRDPVSAARQAAIAADQLMREHDTRKDNK